MAAEPLLPIRHPESDLFICDFAEVIPKSDIASMEHPLFTLATRPDLNIRQYEHNGNTIQITPSVLGMSTIHDKDVLIYVISQLIAGLESRDINISPSREVVFKAHDLLIQTNRPTGGESYKRLDQAFNRLTGTLIETNIKTNGVLITEKFHILDKVKIIYDEPESENKRMVEVKVTLSQWLYNSVIGKECLTINRDYFRLRKPIERRVYELVRKHCGHQDFWKVSMKVLHKKVGASGTLRQFRATIKHLVKHDHLPDYHIALQDDIVMFTPKEDSKIPEIVNDKKGSAITNVLYPSLKTDTYDKAKIILGAYFDVYAIEIEWHQWWDKKGNAPLESPDGAFIGFCKSKLKK